ncbi:hypothetical protein [Streptomyces sp. NPDC007991]|uniref:hypothetical protein n=1 Tax=Streptomyces sp. NPDC007991 TaxID=3364803 RepID=UPI0036E9ADC3
MDGPPYVFAVRARKPAGAQGFVLGFAGTSSGDWYQWTVGGWKNRPKRLQCVDDGIQHDITDASRPLETGRRVRPARRRGRAAHPLLPRRRAAPRHGGPAARHEPLAKDITIEVVRRNPDDEGRGFLSPPPRPRTG